MIEFDFINCVCCGYKIQKIDGPKNKGLIDPNNFMWRGGIVSKVDAGFGSSLDGDIYYMGICDECVDKNTQTGRMRYIGDYMTGYPKYTEDEIAEFDRRRNRENNLNDLLG